MGTGWGWRPAAPEQRKRLIGLGRDVAALESAFEGLPYRRLGQRVFQIKDEIAAVGAQHRAGLDAGEVGHQTSAPVEDAFDAAKQILIRRGVFGQHRSARGVGVIDDDVHLVLVQLSVADRGLAGRGRDARRPVVVGRFLEGVEVFDRMPLDLFEVGSDRWAVDFLTDGREVRGDHVFAEALLNLTDVLGHGPHDVALLAGKVGQVGQQLAALVFDGGLLVLGQLLELFGAFQRLAVDDRDQDHALRTHLQQEALVFGPGLETRVEGLGLGQIFFFEIVLFPVKGFFAESLGQLFAQGFHQLGPCAP